jgi:hypothetical protein
MYARTTSLSYTRAVGGRLGNFQRMNGGIQYLTSSIVISNCKKYNK